MTRMIANILKKPIMLPNIPQFVMQAVLGEMSSLLFDSKKVLPKRALTNGFLFQFDTLEKALQDVL
jgi:NAD dependent epimerase/dehydratase family enzyme